MQCHRCFFFFFFFFFFFLRPQLEVSVRRSPGNGMSLDYEAEKGTALRESVQMTPVGQMMKPLSIESWRNTRGCSASEVKIVKDPAIERPTRRDVGQHAVCIQTGLQNEKVKQYLSGCVPVHEKYGA